mgnify:CR=1 FL=1
MLKFLKNWTLPIAMLVGAVGYPLFISLSFLTPYLIFTMLLLTFCKVSPRDLKPKPLHMWLLLIQIGGALAAYLLLYRFDKTCSRRSDGLHYLSNGYGCCGDYYQVGEGVRPV